MAALIKKFCDAKKSSKREVVCWGTDLQCENFCVDDLALASIFVLNKWDQNKEKQFKYRLQFYFI